MAPSESLANFYSLIKSRRSIYGLSAESPIPDSEIEGIVKFAIEWCPSAWNVQSARAVILYGAEHQKLWDIIGQHMASTDQNEHNRAYVSNRMSQFKGSYGTIMWFEDQTPLGAVASNFPMVASTLPQWSDHSAGMHHFIVWTALEASGLGANLQHYNSEPGVEEKISKAFDIPRTWKINAQLVFGKPVEDPKVRTFEDIDARVVIKNFEMMLLARTRSDLDYYGRRFLLGGTCPVMIDCVASSVLPIGCDTSLQGSNESGGVNSGLNRFFGRNMVGTTEFILGVIYNITMLGVVLLVCVGLLLLLLYTPSLISKCMKRIKKAKYTEKHEKKPIGRYWKDKFMSWLAEDDNDENDTRELRRTYALFAIFVVGLTTAVTLPVTYTQQTKMRTYRVIDSLGPWVGWADDPVFYGTNVSNEANGSWSDCFEIPIPLTQDTFWEADIKTKGMKKWFVNLIELSYYKLA